MTLRQYSRASCASFAFFFILVVSTWADCVPLDNTSMCGPFLNYTDVFVPAGLCQGLVELAIEVRLWYKISPQCLPHIQAYQCVDAYKPCSHINAHPRREICDAIITNCNNDDKAAIILMYNKTVPPCDVNTYSNLNVAQVPPDDYSRCEPYEGTLCKGIVSYVYSQPGYRQGPVEAQLSQIGSILPTLNPLCQLYIRRFLCALSFPDCDEIPVVRGPGNVSFGNARFVCQDLCILARESCGSWFDLAGQQCDEQRVVGACGLGLYQTDQFPVSETYFPNLPFGPTNLAIPCNNVTDNVEAGTCQTLPSTSYCSGLIEHPVWVKNFTCLNSMEVAVDTRLYGALSPPCLSAVSRLTCAKVYPPCDDSMAMPPQSMCDAVTAACTDDVDQEVLKVGKIDLFCQPDSPPNADGSPSNDGISDLELFFPPRCETYTGSLCAGLINYPVYIAGGYTQAMVEAQAAAAKQLFVVLPRNNGCLDTVSKALCGMAFPGCTTSVVSPTLNLTVDIPAAFPMFPSINICLEAHAVCPEYANLALNCSSLYVVNGCSAPVTEVPLFGSTPANFGPLPLDLFKPIYTEPNNMSGVNGRVTVLCPRPLVFVEDTSLSTVNNGSCGIACLTPMFYVDEWQQAGVATAVVSGFSFVFSVILTITWAADRSKKGTPLFWTAFTFVFQTFSIFMSVFAWSDRNAGLPSVSGTMCKNTVAAYVFGDGGFCMFQGIMVCFWQASSLVRASTIVIDGYLGVTLRLSQWPNQRIMWVRRMYHVFCFGMPLILVFIYVGLKVNPWGQFLPICWLRLDDNSNAANYHRFIEHSSEAVCVIGCGMIMYRLYESTTRMQATASRSHKPSLPSKEHSKKRLEGLKARVAVYARMWAFIFVIMFWAVFGHYVQYANSEKSGLYQQRITDWITCILQSADPDSSCPRPATVSNSLRIVLSVAISITGIFMFAIFTSRSEVRAWRNCLGRTIARLRGTEYKPPPTDYTNKPSSTDRSKQSKPTTHQRTHTIGSQADKDKDKDKDQGEKEKYGAKEQEKAHDVSGDSGASLASGASGSGPSDMRQHHESVSGAVMINSHNPSMSSAVVVATELAVLKPKEQQQEQS